MTKNISPEKWEKLTLDKGLGEEVSRPSLTYAQDAWRRLRSNPLAIAGIVIIILMALLAILGPKYSAHTYYDQDLSMNNLPPVLEYYTVLQDKRLYVHKEFSLIELSEKGDTLRRLEPTKNDVATKRREYELDGQEIVIDYSFASAKKEPGAEGGAKFKLLVAGEPASVSGKVRNRTYIFGTDALGRDLYVRVLYGARISLTIALVATLVQFLIGVLYGGISGYVGGTADNIMMRIVDIVSTVPLTLYVIMLMVVLSPGLKTIILAIGTVYWVDMARLVRGEVLSIKQQEYVLAAQSMGASSARIMGSHLIPNAMGTIIVALTMNIPNAIFIESFLSFIGLGISAPAASWGTLCSDALGGLRTYPYQLFFPAIFICVTVLAFNFLGGGLRDALDPRLRK